MSAKRDGWARSFASDPVDAYNARGHAIDCAALRDVYGPCRHWTFSTLAKELHVRWDAETTRAYRAMVRANQGVAP